MGITNIEGGMFTYDGGGDDAGSETTFTGTDGSTATGSSVTFVKSGDDDAEVYVSQGGDNSVVANIECPEGQGGDSKITVTGTDGTSYTGDKITFAAGQYSNVTASVDSNGTVKIGVYYV